MSKGNTGERRSSSNNESNFEPFHSAVNRIPLLRKKAKFLGNKAWNRKQKHRTRGQLTREQTGREPRVDTGRIRPRTQRARARMKDPGAGDGADESVRNDP